MVHRVEGSLFDNIRVVTIRHLLTPDTSVSLLLDHLSKVVNEAYILQERASDIQIWLIRIEVIPFEVFHVKRQTVEGRIVALF